MPYIKQEDRVKFAAILDQMNLPHLSIENCGELNYFISMVCLQYLKHKGKKYQNINDIMGALQGVQQELYRKCFGFYEDEKANLNGDIFE